MEYKMRRKEGWRADEKDMRRKRKRGSEDSVKEGYHDHFQSRKCHCGYVCWGYLPHNTDRFILSPKMQNLNG